MYWAVLHGNFKKYYYLVYLLQGSNILKLTEGRKQTSSLASTWMVSSKVNYRGKIFSLKNGRNISKLFQTLYFSIIMITECHSVVLGVLPAEESLAESMLSRGCHSSARTACDLAGCLGVSAWLVGCAGSAKARVACFSLWSCTVLWSSLYFQRREVKTKMYGEPLMQGSGSVLYILLRLLAEPVR